MPNYTVSQDIDDFMKSDDDASARTELGLGSAATSNTGDFATSEQGGKADSALQASDIGVNVQAQDSVLENTTASFTTEQESKLSAITGSNTGDQDLSGLQTTLTEGAFVDGDKSKLDGITGTNTGDQDLSWYQTILTEGAFQDGDKTKLDGITGTNTGDQDLSALATKTNVLELDNTISFTPSADFQPATKKYVDDNAGNGGSVPDTAETSVWIDGGAMFADSAGATSETIYGTNNSSDIWHVATGEAVYAKIGMPPQWDGSDLEVEFVWGSSAGTATQNVKWGVTSQCAGDDDPWDVAYSATTQTADDPIINNTDLHVVSVTGVTPSGSPQDGDVLFIKIVRETAGATVSSDDAQLYGVRVKYQNKLIQNWYVTKMGSEADDTSGTGEKTAWIAPANGKINAVHSGSSTVTSGSALTVDVQKNATTVLTTKGVIADAGDSTTGGTNHVLLSEPTSFLAGDRISFHVDTFGGTGAKGLHTDLLISWD
jgi:hypothetical protein